MGGVLAVAMTAAACFGGGTPGGDDDDDGVPVDARDIDRFEMCHVDCFGGAACDDGELELWGYAPRDLACDAPIPVDYCVSLRDTCPLGCLAEDVYVRPADDPNDHSQFEWLCLAAPAATTATVCTTDAQCRPTFAIPASDGTVSQTYLRCGAGGTCEPTTAPVITGYGGGCTAGGSPTYEWQWIEGASAGEACLYGQRFSSPCVSTFLSRTCAGDWECPAGSRCNTNVPHASGAVTDGVCTRGTSMRVSDFGC